jgi:hypothetical protein
VELVSFPGEAFITVGEVLLLLTLPLVTTSARDPIEKSGLITSCPAPLFCLLAPLGCNLTCKFRPNWNISKARDFDRVQEVTSLEAIALLQFKAAADLLRLPTTIR